MKTNKTQEKKSKIFATPNKAQEEMIGFAIIVVIVMVILLIFLSIYLMKTSDKNTINSEVDSFVNVLLQYTSDCSNIRGPLLVKDLVYECYNGNKNCLDERKSCEVLNRTLEGITKESWEGQGKIKSYDLNVSVNGEELFYTKKGNLTGDSKGSVEELPPKGGSNAQVSFRAYS